MRKVTVALLASAYVCLALTAALLIWRNGGGWAAGTAVLIGALGLLFGVHGLFARQLGDGGLKSELANLREAWWRPSPPTPCNARRI